jgi:hypothetical protein
MTVSVSLLEEPGRVLKGRLKNLSAHGLSIILAEELSPDCFVRIEWGNTGFSGRMIYCKRKDAEFIAGFEIAGHVYDARQKDAQEKDTPSSKNL